MKPEMDDTELWSPGVFPARYIERLRTLGAIVFGLAGLYFFRYSIEHGLIPPPLLSTVAPPLAELVETLLPPRVALAAGNVGGAVFEDYDADGLDDGANEPGVGGVTVTAYSTTGAVVATTTSYATHCFGANNPAGQGCTATNTPALGSYTLNLAAVANSTPLRIEFTNLPVGYSSTAYNSTAAGSQSTVRFVTTGATATTNLNLGLAGAGEYAPASVTLVVPVQRGLNNDGSLSSPTLSTLNALAYGTTGTPVSGTGAANKRPQAIRSQTGALFGLASYGSNYVWGGTWFKRHAPIGPGGLGAIYLTHIDSGTTNATVWTTIPNAGSNPRGANESSTLSSYWLRDTVAFSATGKIGLGDVDYAAYNQTLYTINLNDRNLYAVPVLLPTTNGGAPASTGVARRSPERSQPPRRTHGRRVSTVAASQCGAGRGSDARRRPVDAVGRARGARQGRLAFLRRPNLGPGRR